MIAFVDESIRSRQGLYLLAAVVFPESEAETCRWSLLGLLRRGQTRIHWRDQDQSGRLAMLERIIEFRVPSLTYACTKHVGFPLERARALCLNRLLWDLKASEIEELVLESRRPYNDEIDRKRIAAAQRARWASKTLHYRHERPLNEPLLWTPDAAAGATADHLLMGARSAYASSLRRMLEVRREVS